MTIDEIKRFPTGGVFQAQMDDALTVVFANDSFYKFVDLSPEDFMRLHKNSLAALISSDNPKSVLEEMRVQISRGQNFSMDIKMLVANGVSKWMWLNVEAMENDNGEEYLYCIFSDITLRQIEQEELRKIQQRYQFVLNHMEDIIFEWDYVTKIMYQMGGQNATFNYSQVINCFPDDLINGGLNLHPDDVEAFINNYKRYDRGEKSAYAEYRIRTSSGTYFWCSTTSVGVFENGKLVRVLGRIANINEQKMQLLEMSRKALRDPLTELYNRKATESLVEEYIESSDKMAAMLVVDLDNFKLVNDTLGHLQGDYVLNEIATKITHTFRNTDILGRIGGDEFVVFLTDIKNEEALHRIAQNVIKQFEIALDGINVEGKLSGSIGISIYPRDARDYNGLLDKADIALYSAKKTGKNKYVIYEDKLSRNDPAFPLPQRAKRTPNESQRWEDLYKMALQKTGVITWIYDVKNNKIQKVLNSTPLQPGSVMYENFSENLMDERFLHPDSIAPLRQLYKKLAQGECDVHTDICTTNLDTGGWDWMTISYTGILDEAGHPDIAIGIATNITEQKNAEIKYMQDTEKYTALDEGIISTSITNLTKNEVEQYRHAEDATLTEVTIHHYEDVMLAGLDKIPNPDDVKRYLLFSREALLDMFAHGEGNMRIEFRRTAPDGRLMWAARSFALLRDAQNGDVYAYCVNRDISNQKQQELSLDTSARTDRLTGTYDQQTAREMMDNSIRQCRADDISFALINFSVDEYSNLLLSDNESAANAVILELSRLVHYKFTDQIVGRFFGSQLLVLVKNVGTQDKIENTVNDIRKQIKEDPRFLQYTHTVSISAGIVFDSDTTVDFDSSHQYTEIALRISKKAGSDKSIVYTNRTKHSSGKATAFTMGSSPKDIILRCALALADVGDWQAGIASVLREMGGYYDAHRIFISELNDAHESPWTSYVWSPEKIKVSDHSAADSIKHLCPYIYSCLEKSPLVIYNDVRSLENMYPQDYSSLTAKGIHSLLAAIVRSGDEVIGYISVINPKRNINDTLFFITLHKFISSEFEKRQLHDKRKFLSDHDSLTSLLNRNKYVEYSAALKEESLISLGIVCSDINGLKLLNNEKGHRYGDLAVAEVARVLRNIFFEYDCYRFAGDEFLIVCENISNQTLIEKMLALKSACCNFQGYSVSLGCAWADVDIRLETLTKHADEKMLSEKQEYYALSDSKTKHNDPKDRTTLLEQIKNKAFVMYLQPKISVTTGKLSGAEALVRYRDSSGTVIFPDKFIPKYEKNGLIKYIDIMMMEQVCQMLKSWVSIGKHPICVSLNLSRATILAANIIEDLCRISDEYDVPRNLIELEVTESLGDLERETIANIGNRISAAGFRFSLDDFGAKYSNLSILSAVKWDTLKVDKSLVNNIFSNTKTQLILQKLFELCQNLAIKTVVEGVETKEQFDAVSLLGCDEIQGYYFDKPLPQDKFENIYMP